KTEPVVLDAVIGMVAVDQQRQEPQRLAFRDDGRVGGKALVNDDLVTRDVQAVEVFQEIFLVDRLCGDDVLPRSVVPFERVDYVDRDVLPGQTAGVVSEQDRTAE